MDCNNFMCILVVVHVSTIGRHSSAVKGSPFGYHSPRSPTPWSVRLSPLYVAKQRSLSAPFGLFGLFPISHSMPCHKQAFSAVHSKVPRGSAAHRGAIQIDNYTCSYNKSP